MRTKKLNLDMESYLNSNELLNFGKSIEESSRLALKKIKAGKKESTVLEESIHIQKFEEAKTAKFDPDFIFNTATKAKKLKKIEEAKTFISTDKYSEDKLKEKFKLDLPYLKSLEEGFKFEDTKKTYNKILEEALVLATDLYKETNTTPRLTSLALDSTLTESEAIAIYENKFKNSLEENFRLKLLNGTLLEENMEPVKKIIKITVDKGIDDEIGEIDPAKMGTVLGFNNVLSDHLKDVILPEGAQAKIKSFIDTQASDYKSIPENAMELLEKLNAKIDAMTTLLSGAEFDKNVEMDEDIDAGKYSAVAKICSLAGDEDKPGCQKIEKKEALEDDDNVKEEVINEAETKKEEVENETPEEDKDKDGIEDEDENHGELPENFEGDHKEASEDDDKDGIVDATEDHGALPDDFEGDHTDAEALENIDKDEQSVEDDVKDAEEVLDDAPEEAKEELETDSEASIDDQVMDSLELHDGEEVAAEDIEKANAEIDPNNTEELESKELIETSKK